MNYDKSSFLAGVAVGRQLKGWDAGKGGCGPLGFYYVATGERELVNRQGDSEYNHVQMPAGTRYCTMYVPGGHMYLFAAARESFTMHTYTNGFDEPLAGSGEFLMGEQHFYYAYGDWHEPAPTPLVECIDPIRSLNSIALNHGQLITQGLIYLYGGE